MEVELNGRKRRQFKCLVMHHYGIDLKRKFVVDAIFIKCLQLQQRVQGLDLRQPVLKLVWPCLILLLVSGLCVQLLLAQEPGLRFMAKMGRYSKALEERGMSPQELEIVDTVAKAYGLDEEKTRLLMAIRLAENGRQGREFGVLTPEAMRFEKASDPLKSFRIQAMHAAGTIAKHYTGDLDSFAARYAPPSDPRDTGGLNKNWAGNVRSIMEKLNG
jgi:hypothetical protein